MTYNQFTVEEFQINKSVILVTINENDGEGERDIKINKSQFEGWLDRSGRYALNNGMYYTDENGTVPVVEARTLQEYYLDVEDVKNDLNDFIMLEKGDEFFVKKMAQYELI